MNEKKEHIIDTAMELFAEKGFEGCSIRDLATKAGVNLAMVNYYFGSKDKLFEAIVEHKARFMRGRLDEIAADSKLDSLQKMDAVIESYVNKIISNPSFHKLLYQELLVNERNDMHDAIIKIFVKNTQTVRGIIEQGIRKKQFRKVDPQLTMATLMGTINQVMLSKAMCVMLMDGQENFDPYTDTNFKARLVRHLKQVLHSLLLNK
ncbi:TetR/AcrR family transcriptional regulator [Sediminibacterium soli]|uniref:TetR/AcrR family transcriptional regulator n=1 Tax=Sediminibacterium soli TaxID=2698829 RepID=UPI00137B241F|nr:TetR/AcrR family transcriptional regulator [Sediminibacterium soli]NCI46982.1 TetR/AcrR family transcriptional regulator [Sediminibacterium soli]